MVGRSVCLELGEAGGEGSSRGGSICLEWEDLPVGPSLCFPLPEQPDPTCCPRTQAGSQSLCGLGFLEEAVSHNCTLQPQSYQGPSGLPIHEASLQPLLLKPGPSRIHCSCASHPGSSLATGAPACPVAAPAVLALATGSPLGHPAVLWVCQGLQIPLAPAGCCHPGTRAHPSWPPLMSSGPLLDALIALLASRTLQGPL